jgi:hypothetical protein
VFLEQVGHGAIEGVGAELHRPGGVHDERVAVVLLEAGERARRRIRRTSPTAAPTTPPTTPTIAVIDPGHLPAPLRFTGTLRPRDTTGTEPLGAGRYPLASCRSRLVERGRRSRMGSS